METKGVSIAILFASLLHQTVHLIVFSFIFYSASETHTDQVYVLNSLSSVHPSIHPFVCLSVSLSVRLLNPGHTASNFSLSAQIFFGSVSTHQHQTPQLTENCF